jgi:hypoxanthine phosphoribosyltransferase
MQILDKHFEIFISSEKIKKRVREIAGQINKDYRDKNPLFLSILNGAFIFTADLFREVTVPAEVSFIKLKSYRKTESTGKVKELVGLEDNIFNRNIVIVEDIVDTGNTLNHVLREFMDLGARSIEILTLLHKPESTKKPVNLKYVGFEIPDKFVVGYGMDYDGYGRNLADLYRIGE